MSVRDLQQWAHEAKTMQREEDKDGVRFTTTTTLHPEGTGHRQQKRKRGRTYRVSRLLRFSRLAKMGPVRLFCSRYLQQWEHEAKTIQSERREDGKSAGKDSTREIHQARLTGKKRGREAALTGTSGS